MSLRTFAAPARFEISALKAGKTRLLYPGAPLPAGVNVAIVPAGHTLEKFDHLPSYGAVNREREETAPPSDMIGCTRLINSSHHRPRACRRYQSASRLPDRRSTGCWSATGEQGARVCRRGQRILEHHINPPVKEIPHDKTRRYSRCPCRRPFFG